MSKEVDRGIGDSRRDQEKKRDTLSCLRITKDFEVRAGLSRRGGHETIKKKHSKEPNLREKEIWQFYVGRTGRRWHISPREEEGGKLAAGVPIWGRHYTILNLIGSWGRVGGGRNGGGGSEKGIFKGKYVDADSGTIRSCVWNSDKEARRQFTKEKDSGMRSGKKSQFIMATH